MRALILLLCVLTLILSLDLLPKKEDMDGKTVEDTPTVNTTLPTVETVYVELSPEEQAAVLRAEGILSQITHENMSPMEVAFSIYRWCGSNIQYVGRSVKTHWATAAMDAFDSGTGDCYSYFSVAKALLTAAGIDNLDIQKEGGTSRHYWNLINLGSGWYHIDCTPRRIPGQFFMNTDAELETYSQANNHSHTFDSKAYPPRATTSVQHLVDYEGGQILGEGLCD